MSPKPCRYRDPANKKVLTLFLGEGPLEPQKRNIMATRSNDSNAYDHGAELEVLQVGNVEGLL